MKIAKYDISQLFLLLLFLVTPLVMSFEDTEVAVLLSARVLPSAITKLSSIIRWIIVGYLILYTFHTLSRNKKNYITRPLLFLTLFYFVQFLAALFDGYDVFRFSSMTLIVLLVPPAITSILKKNINIIKPFLYLVIVFLILSFLLNGHLILSGFRFWGFMNNPNIYGLSVIFWITVLILAEKERLIKRRFFAFLLVALIISLLLTGSRNALLGAVIVLFASYINQLRRSLKLIFILIISLFVVSYFIDLSYITGRFLNFADAIEDSGRDAIWERAYYSIRQNLLWGNGMDANWRIADTGNMHNCYIRFVLNMGLVFTIIAIFMYIMSIISTFLEKRLPLALGGYLLAFAVMNIGEDFFVGLGSSAFIYLLFIYGFIGYYISKRKDLYKKIALSKFIKQKNNGRDAYN